MYAVKFVISLRNQVHFVAAEALSLRRRATHSKTVMVPTTPQDGVKSQTILIDIS